MTDENDIVVPDLLPVQDDLVFKRVLTHYDALPVLRFVTSGLLNTTVTQVTVLNIETPKESVDVKDQKFDINCSTDSGDKIAMEMQADHMKGDSFKNDHSNMIVRAEFGACELFSSQQGSGLTFRNFMRSYQTTFLGYTIFPNRPRYESRLLFRHEDGEPLNDKVGIIFIELTKLNEVLKKLSKEMTRLEAFVSFMVTASNPKYYDKLRELIKEWEELSVAYELLTTMSKNEHERALFRSRRLAQLQKNTEFAEVKAEGRFEGIGIGRVEGIEIGKKAAVISMLKRFTVDEVAEELDVPVIQVLAWQKEAQK